ncbi:TPA: hypothetical protein ACJGJT_004066 [Salmonella enterica subsp. enterica serovar Chester]
MHDCDDENTQGWLLHLTHEYHDKSSDAFLLIPDKLDYNYIYKVVARLQYIHSEGCYETEDLSGQQMKFLLNKLLSLDFITDETITSHSEKKVHELNLFWNWEQGVVKFGFDEDSRNKGENPYFYPDVIFSDYEPDGAVPALLEMDKHFH